MELCGHYYMSHETDAVAGKPAGCQAGDIITIEV